MRGASGSEFARTLKEIIRINKPDVLTLQEPRISGSRAQSVIGNLGFQHQIIVEARGFSGGICILWNRHDINISQIQSHEQFLHVKVSEGSSLPWLLIVVYASPRASEREELWEAIQNIAISIDLEWMVVGDFNEIAYASGKKGGGPIDMGRWDRFLAWINECQLLDLGYVGSKYTWRGP